MNTKNPLPEITVQMLKEAGLTCYQIEFAGTMGSHLYSKGYTFEQIRDALNKYAYFSTDSGAPCYRLKPKFDPDAVFCPVCNDPEIVMRPTENGYRCPQCERPTRRPSIQHHPETQFSSDCGLRCACGYNGHEGWREGQIDEDVRGNATYAWFCPECDAEICTEGDDCPPDEFGQL